MAFGGSKGLMSIEGSGGSGVFGRSGTGDATGEIRAGFCSMVALTVLSGLKEFA